MQKYEPDAMQDDAGAEYRLFLSTNCLRALRLTFGGDKATTDHHWRKMGQLDAVCTLIPIEILEPDTKPLRIDRLPLPAASIYRSGLVLCIVTCHDFGHRSNLINCYQDNVIKILKINILFRM